MGIQAVHPKRRTVMSADVVGYTAMMAVDAGATLSSLLVCFRRIQALVTQFGGRVIDAPGDNILVEFPTEVGAVLCAVEVQRALEALRNTSSTPGMHVRIGLHQGDSLEYCGRLYGNAVNVAARLQAAAEPDGIFVSEDVTERLPSPIWQRFDELGPRRYKNVPEAVATYRVRL